MADHSTACRSRQARGSSHLNNRGVTSTSHVKTPQERVQTRQTAIHNNNNNNNKRKQRNSRPRHVLNCTTGARLVHLSALEQLSYPKENPPMPSESSENMGDGVRALVCSDVQSSSCRDVEPPANHWNGDWGTSSCKKSPM